MFLEVNGNEEQITKLEEFLNPDDCGWEWKSDNILYIEDDEEYIEMVQQYLVDHHIKYKEATNKLFRVVVIESQSYEVYIKASTKEEAEEIAEDTYGYKGDVFHTDVNVLLVEEEEQ